MRHLILFRHGKAEPRAAAGRDFDRALTRRGREDAALMGAVIARLGPAPDLVLVSPAKRARQTWEEAAAALGKVRVELRPDLYNATAEEIAHGISTCAEPAPESLMVIGHNPGLQELAVDLLVKSAAAEAQIEQVSERFATASVAVFGLDSEGRASLGGLFHAREHGGEGE